MTNDMISLNCNTFRMPLIKIKLFTYIYDFITRKSGYFVVDGWDIFLFRRKQPTTNDDTGNFINWFHFRILFFNPLSIFFFLSFLTLGVLGSLGDFIPMLHFIIFPLPPPFPFPQSVGYCGAGVGAGAGGGVGAGVGGGQPLT